ncbi:hypothetical protein P22_2013 [Propionispora sp. 2/2-37]|nr:hypothetical protein P22_2013 [Propionispora sp. 2/2-37]
MGMESKLMGRPDPLMMRGFGLFINHYLVNRNSCQ